MPSYVINSYPVTPGEVWLDSKGHRHKMLEPGLRQSYPVRTASYHGKKVDWRASGWRKRSGEGEALELHLVAPVKLHQQPFAINGHVVKVGAVWQDEQGRATVIKSIDILRRYPVETTDGYLWHATGKSTDHGRPHLRQPIGIQVQPDTEAAGEARLSPDEELLGDLRVGGSLMEGRTVRFPDYSFDAASVSASPTTPTVVKELTRLAQQVASGELKAVPDDITQGIAWELLLLARRIQQGGSHDEPPKPLQVTKWPEIPPPGGRGILDCPPIT